MGGFPPDKFFLYLSIRARSFFFVSASNPTIETCGMFFESKWKRFQLGAKEYFTTTILVEGGEDMDAVLSKMFAVCIRFTVIAKPDRGEWGWAVKK